jgi:hypothetical protein
MFPDDIPEYAPWMREPFSWTGETQDNASYYDPRAQEQLDEFDRFRDEEWAAAVARQAGPHDWPGRGGAAPPLPSRHPGPPYQPGHWPDQRLASLVRVPPPH